MDNYVSEETVETTKEILHNPERVEAMVEKNYKLGLKYYSYTVLRQNIRHLMGTFYGNP